MSDRMRDSNEFELAYSEESFWDKLKGYAKSAGKEVVEKALLLFYAAQQEQTPKWAKAPTGRGYRPRTGDWLHG
jgi:hypothetical protein